MSARVVVPAFVTRSIQGIHRAAVQCATIAFSALTEKNPQKVLASNLPVVLSATRVIVVAFAVAMIHQIWHAGIAGWPEAWLAIAIVLALPLIACLEALGPERTVDVFDKLLDKFGTGATRTIASVYSVEPSLHDDHRDDSGGTA